MDLIASSLLLMVLWDAFKSRCFHEAGPLMSHGENLIEELAMRKSQGRG